MTDPYLPTTLDEIDRVPILRDRVARLRGIVAESPQRLVPWIGAGLSAGHGFPTWAAFIDHLANHETLGVERSETALRLKNEGLYDLAAEYLVRNLTPADFEQEMWTAFQRVPASVEYPHVLERLGARTFVTTNYDRVLESALRHLAPLTPDAAASHAARGDYALLKLHGTIERRESWTLTTADYVRHYNTGMSRLLDDLFCRQTVLFIGCSLVDDLYLDTLKALPEHRRGRHYALLAVGDAAEAKYRGEALQQWGIDVIPYMPDRDHTFVRQLLDSIKPSVSEAMGHIRQALAQPTPRLGPPQVELMEWRKVARTLNPSDSELVAARFIQWVSVARSLPAESSVRVQPSEIADMARHASELNRRSRRTLTAAIETATAVGRDVEDLKEKLAALPDPERPTPEPPISANSIRTLYRAHRTGRPRKAASILEDIGSGDSAAYQRDRLELFGLRVALSSGPEAGQETWGTFSQSVSPPVLAFGSALVHLHNWQFDQALVALDEAENGWRHHARRVPFLEWNRAIALLGRAVGVTGAPDGADPGDVVAAVEHLTNASKCYDDLPAPSRRLFWTRRIVPVEFAYEPRSFCSKEMKALLDFWRFLAGRAASDETTEAPEDLFKRIATSAADDLLLRWALHVGSVALPDQVPAQGAHAESTYFHLLSETSENCPGLLRDVVLFYSTAPGTERALVDQGRHLRATVLPGVII